MRTLAGLVIVILFGAYLVSIAGSYKPGDGPTTSTSARATIVPPELLASARARINFHISKPAWRRGGFGIVAIADFTFANDNSVAVKDVTIGCTFYGASGTRLGTGEQTIYQTFPARKSTVVREVNLGFINSQSATASCEVENLVPLGEPGTDELQVTKPPAAAPAATKPNLRPAALPVRP